MNLSTYLQMPPAPVAVQGTSTQVAQGAATVASAAAGASLGFDFAQVMAKQMVRFTQQQRQEFAASPTTSLRDEARLSEREPVETDSQPHDSRTPTQNEARDHKATTPSTSRSNADSEHRASRRAQRREEGDHSSDPLAGVMAQIAAVAPTQSTPLTESVEVTEPNASTPIVATANVPDVSAAKSAISTDQPDTLSQMAGNLKTLELGPRVRIITDPKQAPNPESLVAFAKSMGLDEGAIQALMAQTAPNGVAVPAPANQVNGLPHAVQLATATPHGLDNMTSSGLDALTSATLQNAQISVTPSASVTSIATTPVAAELTHGNLLPAMTPADMASIQQLQVTVLPAATALPITSHVAGASAKGNVLATEALSLLGGPLMEQDIADLAAGFADSGTGTSADSQSGESGFGFQQAMSHMNNADKTAGSKTNAAQSAASMGEVYDQLSDKLSTEMAARIHKQLSDGQWKMKFGLRPENLGGVEIQLEMKDGKLDAVFRADNPLTRDLLQNSSQRLRDALENFGIQAGLVQIGQDGSGAQQRHSGHAAHPAQVGHNSPTSLDEGEDVSSNLDTVRNKANASLLDLYA
jgi:flagellar hook-length control protein FliK